MLVPANALPLVLRTLPGVRATLETPGGALPVASSGAQGDGHALRPGILTSLRAYQVAGVSWAVNQDGAALIWPPGAGKTLGGILWALAAPGPVVCVTRAGARETIAREVRRATTIEPCVLLGARARPMSSDVRFVVAAWETLPAHVETLAALRPASVVWDELHYGRAGRTHRRVPMPDGTYARRDLENIASAARKLANVVPRRLGLTATPIVDRRRNLYGQLSLLLPGEFGRTYWEFVFRYCAGHAGEFGGVADKGRSCTEELQERLGYVFHVVPPEVVYRELPPKIRTVRYLGKDDLDDPSPEAQQELAGVLAGRADRHYVVDVRLAHAASRKRSVLLEELDEAICQNAKTIVFVGRHWYADQVYRAVQRGWPEVACWIAHGGIPRGRRQAALDEYMAARAPAVLVAVTDSIGQSVNLQDTDLILVAQLPWTPGLVIQLEGRGQRLGQTRPLRVIYLIAEGTIDERIAELLLEKLPQVVDVTGDADAAGMAASMAGAGSDALLDELWDSIGAEKDS